jgi:hypothetical protein
VINITTQFGLRSISAQQVSSVYVDSQNVNEDSFTKIVMFNGDIFHVNQTVIAINALIASDIASSSFTIGDLKSGAQPTDHNGWIILNGRLKSTLTPNQQANATAFGIGANLTLGTGRAFIQGPILALIGSTTITQANLPNLTLNISGSTGNAGAHSHTINGNANAASGPANLGAFATGAGSSWSVISSAPDHAHSVSGSTASINGGVTQQSYIPAGIGCNQFIFLGL